MAMIRCPECAGQVSDKARACPHCGYPVSMQEEAQPKYSLLHDKPLMNGNEGAASFMAVLAWLTWIGGLIAAIAAASIVRDGGFVIFLSIAAGAGISGGVLMCMSELLRNINAMARVLDTLELTTPSSKESSQTNWGGYASPLISHRSDEYNTQSFSSSAIKNQNTETLTPSDEPQASDAPVIPLHINQDIIACPKCGTQQKANRNVCYHCGTAFEK